MIGPYQMVLINLIGSLLVFGGALFCRFVFPKKKINLLILLFTVSLLPLVSLLRIGDYESGDFNIHVYRAMAFYQNLTDGNLMPSWAGLLNGTYGYPLFVFLNPLPYYLTSLFHLLGFSFISSLKLFIGAAYILSGITMYFFTKETLKHELAAFTAAIFYLFMPYHLIDLHFRIDVGEILCFALIPLLLLFTYRLFQKTTLINILWTGLLFALLIMSHQAIALLSLFLVAALLLTQLLLNLRKIYEIRLWLSIAAAFILGIVVSGYVWLPYLIFAKYNLSATLFGAPLTFVAIQDILYSPWRYGFLFQGPRGELSLLVGYAQLFILGFLSIGLTFKKIKTKYTKEISIGLITSFFLIFMLTEYSTIVWQTVPVIKNMLLSYRVLSILSFSISLLAGYFVLVNKNRSFLIWLIIILTIGTTILNWGHRRVIPQITDKELTNNLPLSSYEGEGLYYIGNTIWFSSKPVFIKQVPAAKIDVLQGQAQVKVLSIASTKHIYSVASADGATLKENTLYYPGWKVFASGRETVINFTDKTNPGIITFNVPAGKSQITVVYKDPAILQAMKAIFIASLIVILGYTLAVISRNPKLATKLKKLRKRFV